jgi:hypothetical protein
MGPTQDNDTSSFSQPQRRGKSFEKLPQGRNF